MRQRFVGVSHECGHVMDRDISSCVNRESLLEMLQNDICPNCKRDALNLIKERDNKAINKARAIMVSKGFNDCSYTPINDGKAVEVTLFINL